jgi:hypothetical protein
MEHAVLQSTRLYLPYEMSRIIARALQLAHGRHKSQKVDNGNHNSDNENARNQISDPHLRQTN